jgi:hypothetical protein
MIDQTQTVPRVRQRDALGVEVPDTLHHECELCFGEEAWNADLEAFISHDRRTPARSRAGEYGR